jgi:hypothetical protein
MKGRATLLLTALLTANISAKDIGTPPGDGLVVHEWGVFRVNDDAEFANADLRALWDDLPGFAYGHIKGRLVPQHWGAFEIRKNPVVFFHAPKPMVIRMKIDFPGGMAGVWFPATMIPTVDGLERQPKAGNTLEWFLGIKACPENWRPKNPALQEVGAKHWVNHLRRVKADEVFTQFSHNPTDVEREKFVYYDGIFPQGKWLKLVVDKERISLTSRVKHPVFDVTIVDRRGDAVKVARIAKLAAGETIENVAFKEAEPSRFVSEAGETLVKQLVGSGLFEDEAQSLLDTWRKDMFETPGLCMFYRMPQAEYDTRLPMRITHETATVTRVGLVYHGHLEPDFAERVLELVKQLDSPRFAQRDAATKKLLAIGPAALVQLQRLRGRKELSVEVRERIDALVKRWSTAEAFEK